MSTRRPIFFSRPADRSLQAYKDWIQDMARALESSAGVKMTEARAEDHVTEEQWEASWKKFWGMGADPGEDDRA